MDNNPTVLDTLEDAQTMCLVLNHTIWDTLPDWLPEGTVQQTLFRFEEHDGGFRLWKQHFSPEGVEPENYEEYLDNQPGSESYLSLTDDLIMEPSKRTPDSRDVTDGEMLAILQARKKSFDALKSFAEELGA